MRHITCFWPFAAAMELGQAGLKMFQDYFLYLSKANLITFPPPPEWATANRIVLNLDTMRLRSFVPMQEGGGAVTPVLIHAPYAGHGSTIADYAKGQSLVETLQAGGVENIFVTDWKSATSEKKNFGIDKYLADLDEAVEHVGGSVHLVGLCQGGWMCAMYAARFPAKVRSLVLAGAPIDTDGGGFINVMAHTLPMSFFEEVVALGGGLMRGHVMNAGWKSMHPEKQWMKYLELYKHIEDKGFIQRTQTFESWYEHPIDLPGAFFLQTVQQLFKENRFVRGEFVALNQRLSLKEITCPVYLMAGKGDDITPVEQVFRAERYLGTPKDQIVKVLAPGGHIGLFMGTQTLAEYWPRVAHWIRAVESDAFLSGDAREGALIPNLSYEGSSSWQREGLARGSRLIH
jgi:poly(3-hydroxybutyrate) depolymerase